MFLAAVNIFLYHLHDVEVGSLGSPRQEIGECTKHDISSLCLISSGKGDALTMLLDEGAVRTNEAHSHLLGSSKCIAVVECERHVHATCGIVRSRI